MNYKHIIISRTDAIGDVTLTLPLCGFLKSVYPDTKISFLGKTYTEPVINTCTAIDGFINYDTLLQKPEKEQVDLLKSTGADVIVHVFPVKHLAYLAKKTGIGLRIGTRNRFYHWFTCNKLVSLSRKNSLLHEAALNLLLLKPLTEVPPPSRKEIYRYYDFTKTVRLPAVISNLLSDTKFNLVIHPKSHGSGMEWSLDKYRELIVLLPEDRFRIFISGSEKEKPALKEWIAGLPPADLVDLTGTMTLPQLIAFLHVANGLVASGTGPLHLAAASGIHTLGLFPPKKPIHAMRWGPVGEKATALTSTSDDLDTIKATDVYKKISAWEK
ncbi:glycosyltransferase family 9 protein [Hufsiella ginkgonis]|nr:glycosyltransferase family 9 protein [Hufsiella ginkgonis]